jgi:hypothetical protein
MNKKQMAMALERAELKNKMHEISMKLLTELDMPEIEYAKLEHEHAILKEQFDALLDDVQPEPMIAKKVSISLPDGEWPYIDELIKNGHIASYSEYFRRVHLHSKGGIGEVLIV